MKNFLATVLAMCFWHQVVNAQVKNYQINGSLQGQSLEISLSSVHSPDGRLHLLVHCLERPTDSVAQTTCYASTDSGQHWSGTAGIPGLITHQEIFDPGCVIDEQSGRAYASYKFAGDTVLRIARSSDWGATWNTTRTLIPLSSNCDFPVIALRGSSGSGTQETVYVAIMNVVSPNKELVFRSTDQGVTFSSWGSIPISDFDEAAQLFVGHSGSLFLMSVRKLWKGSQHDTTWDSINAISAGTILQGAQHHKGVAYSFSGAPDTSFLCLAYVKSGGNIAMRCAYSPYALSSATVRDNIENGTYADSAIVPRIAVDSQARCIAIAYATPTDSNVNYYVLKLVVTTDLGATWNRLVISDTASSFDHSAGLGSADWPPFVDFTGLEFLDSNHLGLAWSDTRNGVERAHFANVQIGTMFRNEFDGVSAEHLVYFPTHDTSNSSLKKTVHSQASRILNKDSSYYVRPDAVRYNNIVTTNNNFVFNEWNKGTADFDFNFAHSFTSTGLRPQTEEAHFIHVDSLTDSNNLEGATAGNVYWGTGQFDSASTLTTSPLRIDTAYRFISLSNYYYDFQAKSKIANGLISTTPWDSSWFEAWSKNGKDTLVGNMVFPNFTLSGSTHISALYKTHLKSSNLAALDLNGGRKVCWNTDSSWWNVVYQSYGNVYFLQSVDNTFCEFNKEYRLNQDASFGKASHPAVAYFQRHSVSHTARAVMTVWEETIGTTRTVYCRCRKNLDTAFLAAKVVATFPATADPAAPSICAAQVGNSNAYGSIRGAIVWHQAGFVKIAAIDTLYNIGTAQVVDTTHGLYPTIEAGYKANGDTADFTIGWQDSTNRDNGKFGGIRTLYAQYTGSGWVFPQVTQLPMHNYWQSNRHDMWGTLYRPSIAIGSDPAHPLIVSYIMKEKNTIFAMPYDSSTKIIWRWGAYTRVRPTFDAPTWGLYRIIAKYGNDTTLWAPSVTQLSGDNGNYYLAFHKRNADTLTDSVQYGHWAYSGDTGASRKDVYPDNAGITLSGYSARTPQFPYSQQTSSSKAGVLLCSKGLRTEFPQTIKRVSPVTCDSPDNQISHNLKGHDELSAYCGNGKASLAIGEFSVIDNHGGSQALHMSQPPPNAACATPADIGKLNGTVNFRPASDTIAIVFFRAPGTADTNEMSSAFSSTRGVMFSTTLNDSATDSTVSPLDLQTFYGGHATTACGFDTVWLYGLHSTGKTYYVHTRIDTMGAWSSAEFSFARVYSDDKLSDVIASGIGMGKQAMMTDRGRAGMVQVLPNPIDLVVGPNPFSTSTHVYYSIPIDDADDIADILLFDMQGKDVSRLVHDVKPVGRHEVDFDGTKLPAGEYVLAVHLKNHMQAKMIGVVR